MATPSAVATVTPPPRENLFRAIIPGGVELRAADDGGMPTMAGHFAVFNEWTEIDSWFEGRFLEQIAPGAFKKTMRENRDQIRVMLEHGQDPQVGQKPLGPIEVLSEDETGAYYEVPLIESSYTRDLVPALENGLYGASFRFQVVREEFNAKPKPSKANPQGLPERTITEARLFEFGPVAFPAYVGATAGLRSYTDTILIRQLLPSMIPNGERDGIPHFLGGTGLASLIREAARASAPEPEPSEDTTPPAEPEPPAATTPLSPQFGSREEYLEWLDWHSRT